MAKSLIGSWPMSDRVLMVKLLAKPFNINMIQVYAPTQDYDDETIEEFYEQIKSAVTYTKSSDIICIMGVLSAKVGNVKTLKSLVIMALANKMEEIEDL